MSDRELLELAAKAAGRGIADYLPGEPDRCWNPLTDDGDALRLAVSLPGMSLEWVIASAWQAHDSQEDRQSYVRRTIVERAALLGRLLP